MLKETISPRSVFGIRFSLLARRWRRQVDAHLAEVGLTDATWVPLIHLRQSGGGITHKELAALVGVDVSSLVRVLDILEHGGLIERHRDESDGRCRRISLTPTGEQRVTEIAEELARAEEAMLVDMSDADLSALLAHFRTIDRRMTRLEDDKRKAAEQ
ncbi:MarR family winged helix-turn-helix transcriptional regulator [Pleomorphomonas sp. PLEO]|uniref:MarR family winged helix-turn-helix transcriptional regulator n=1 Tax=Pleomorphomonas sp. PLEO TaxID=3239306 RepID=UPI00351E995C